MNEVNQGAMLVGGFVTAIGVLIGFASLWIKSHQRHPIHH